MPPEPERRTLLAGFVLGFVLLDLAIGAAIPLLFSGRVPPNAALAVTKVTPGADPEPSPSSSVAEPVATAVAEWVVPAERQTPTPLPEDIQAGVEAAGEQAVGPGQVATVADVRQGLTPAVLSSEAVAKRPVAPQAGQLPPAPVAPQPGAPRPVLTSEPTVQAEQSPISRTSANSRPAAAPSQVIGSPLALSVAFDPPIAHVGSPVVIKLGITNNLDRAVRGVEISARGAWENLTVLDVTPKARLERLANGWVVQSAAPIGPQETGFVYVTVSPNQEGDQPLTFVAQAVDSD